MRSFFPAIILLFVCNLLAVTTYSNDECRKIFARIIMPEYKLNLANNKFGKRTELFDDIDENSKTIAQGLNIIKKSARRYDKQMQMAYRKQGVYGVTKRFFIAPVRKENLSKIPYGPLYFFMDPIDTMIRTPWAISRRLGKLNPKLEFLKLKTNEKGIPIRSQAPKVLQGQQSFFTTFITTPLTWGLTVELPLYFIVQKPNQEKLEKINNETEPIDLPDLLEWQNLGYLDQDKVLSLHNKHQNAIIDWIGNKKELPSVIELRKLGILKQNSEEEKCLETIAIFSLVRARKFILNSNVEIPKVTGPQKTACLTGIKWTAYDQLLKEKNKDSDLHWDSTFNTIFRDALANSSLSKKLSPVQLYILNYYLEPVVQIGKYTNLALLQKILHITEFPNDKKLTEEETILASIYGLRRQIGDNASIALAEKSLNDQKAVFKKFNEAASIFPNPIDSWRVAHVDLPAFEDKGELYYWKLLFQDQRFQDLREQWVEKQMTDLEVLLKLKERLEN